MARTPLWTILPQTNKKEKQAPASRFEIITHQGKDILVANYSLASREEVWALTNQIDAWLSRQKPDSVRILFEMDRPYYEAAHVNHWKKSMGRYDTMIVRSCFVNAGPLMQMIGKGLRAFATLTNTPYKKNRGVFFKDKDAALNWLAEA